MAALHTSPGRTVSIELEELDRATTLRGLTRRWIFRSMRDQPAADVANANLPGGKNLLPVVQRVLAARGFTEPDQIKNLLDPKLNDLCDPALMPGIETAVRRIIEGIRADQSIVIYGDYDVDGITATAILYHLIKTIQPAARVRSYVPHRIEEGYGLNADALRQLKADGADLVISVDCGITAVEPARVAREIALDLIITDHHALKAEALPDALAIVHPGLPGSTYPFGDLCGAGVAFKVGWHLARTWCNSERVSDALQQTLLNMLPLVALGTIADVVPLLGENRIMTAFGLRLIKQSPLVGLHALIEASNLAGEKIDSERVGFALAPRLNACGRMGHAEEAMRLFTDATADESRVIAERLSKLNAERQGIERRIFEHAAKLAEDAGMTADDHRVIVLAHESWHPGVVGIVCSRMVERFGRPVVLLNRNAQGCKGSARSIDGYSIHEALTAAAKHLTTFGGHAMAAGLALATESMPAFTEALVAHANERISVDQLTPSLTIDCETAIDELDRIAVEQLHRLSPFGRGNRSPRLLLRDITIIEPPRQMGANGRHLSMRVRQAGGNGNARTSGGGGRVMRAVWWGEGGRASDIAAGMTIDAVIEPKLNDWNGSVSVEAEVRDIRICPATTR